MISLEPFDAASIYFNGASPSYLPVVNSVGKIAVAGGAACLASKTMGQERAR